MNDKNYTKIEYILVAILTIFFAFCAFFKLGSHFAPQTFLTLNREDDFSDEITLRFDADTYIEKMSVFVGYKGAQRVNLFAAGTDYDGWEMISDEEKKVGSAFCWGDFEIKRSVESLCLVLQDSEIIYHELVIIDGEGHQILPNNYAEYPTLFDEQNMYVENPSYYYRTMFDEIYHGRTAYEFIHHLSIYENTHPPLGKTIIGIGIRLFGMNPFGWRFIPAVFGIMTVPLMYIWGKKVTKTILGAALTAWLWDVSFMSLTLSRIATIDIIVAFFAVLMYLLFYKYLRAAIENESFKTQTIWIIACGVATGCAIATKWTAIYLLALMALLFFAELIWFLAKEEGFIKGLGKHKSYVVKLAIVSVVGFVIIPLLIYVLSYIPFLKPYPDQNLIEQAIGNGQSMLNYHKNVTESHPYESPWYEWFLDIQPLLDAYTNFGNGKISSVATFGNPIIWWVGIPAVIYQFVNIFRKKDFNSVILVSAYVAVVLPWVFITRTVFIYQYFLASIFMIMMIAKSIAEADEKFASSASGALVFITLCLFVLFFPELTGVPASYEYLDALEWFESWIFV